MNDAILGITFAVVLAVPVLFLCLTVWDRDE